MDLPTGTAKVFSGGRVSSGRRSRFQDGMLTRVRKLNPNVGRHFHFLAGDRFPCRPRDRILCYSDDPGKKPPQTISIPRGILVIATPYASGFDLFFIADDVQFKFDRCIRSLQETVHDLPTFGVGHSLGSVIHLLIGSRYVVEGSGNVFMAFNNKTEMALKHLKNLSPPILKQVLPMVDQLPPLYMELVKGIEDSTPKPEETRQLIKSYYGVSRNLLIKFKDDTLDETSTLAQLLSSDSAISSVLDMSIRSMPGDHALPLQKVNIVSNNKVLPDVPPAMANAVNRGGEFLANLTVGTPWETAAREVGNTLGVDSGILRANISKDVDLLVDMITSWISSSTGPRLPRS
ncbi:hypothetical protein HHK36_004822 [Tetracentron sinense]|uniref:Uncharacterized protein n=1 Tax=Tetracentron sinense TaxID=13715 RepID=A0A835DQ79_TETSI|nr:hypothetical protein HHK36_004822 [Tetracentron sinense]